jgi:hypothetical protein
VSVCLILVLMAAICWRLAAGTAPGGQGLSGAVFVLPPGVGISALTLAATSGFLAFAGFESAGSLGEESLVPRRMIPCAIIAAVAFGAVFYVACVTVQTLGFGTGAAGVSVFRHSQAPLGELARLCGHAAGRRPRPWRGAQRARRGARRGDRSRPDDVRVRAAYRTGFIGLGALKGNWGSQTMPSRRALTCRHSRARSSGAAGSRSDSAWPPLSPLSPLDGSAEHCRSVRFTPPTR